MNRGKILGVGLALGLTAGTGLFVARNAIAQNVDYPLTSVADSGTELNEARASKIRDLATLVVTNPDQDGIIRYTSSYSGGAQRAQAVMQIGEEQYTINVRNYDDANSNQSDFIQFAIRPFGTGGRDTLTEFTDIGLDSRVNHGRSGLDVSFSDGRFGSPLNDEHYDLFQDRFDTAVDTALTFYRR